MIYGSFDWYLDHLDSPWFNSYRDEPCQYDPHQYQRDSKGLKVRESSTMHAMRETARAVFPCEKNMLGGEGNAWGECICSAFDGWARFVPH